MTPEPTKPKPRRRWLQFRLRTMLVAVLLLCGWLAWMAHTAREQRKVVEWVQEMGGTVWYEYQIDEDGNTIDDAQPPGPKWLREFLGIEFVDEVVSVNLNHTQVSDLTPLAKLNSLQTLDLYNTQVSDLTPLAGLTSLEFLSFSGTQASDVTPLAGLTNLEWLTLGGTQVSDLTPLATLTSLEMLVLQSPWLNNTPVSEEQVEAIQQALPNCKIFWPRSNQSQ